GGRVTPLTLSGPGVRARAREETLRGELRALLVEGGGAPAREMLSLEPLLEDFDGAEIAAAALLLLERARQRPVAKAGAAQAERAERPDSPWVRLFLAVGSRDGATSRDIVGGIANEAEIASDKIGKIEMRDTHTIVEIARESADHVVKALKGTMIRGRLIAARLEREAAPRERGEGTQQRERGGRPPIDRPRGDRPRGDRPRGDRERFDRPRGERPRPGSAGAPPGGPRGRPRGAG
ncbi:MAG: DbpA RNA binding domain-containing protein, partial [Gemmatimonadota bacterium]|nr:DbpA RNA binding domain-containing protein [Gemmatimonadota bacterium]